MMRQEDDVYHFWTILFLIHYSFHFSQNQSGISSDLRLEWNEYGVVDLETAVGIKNKSLLC